MPSERHREAVVDVEHIRTLANDAWARMSARIADVRSGEYADADEILNPLSDYIDAKIKQAFAEHALYGEVIL